MSQGNLNFPKQKLPKSQKNEEWVKRCVESSRYLTSAYDSSRRSPRSNKIRNYNLYNGKFDPSDLEYVMDPLGTKDQGYDFPANMQYYPVATRIFDLLIGEETKRAFSYVVKAVNPEAISKREEDNKNAIIESLKNTLFASMDPKQVEEIKKSGQDPESIAKYRSMSHKDMRENTATQILSFLTKYLDLNREFLIGWEDALIAGEEIYHVDIVAGEPVASRKNPLEIYALIPHNKFLLDEAEIIVEETWASVSEVIDMFYDELKPFEIDKLEEISSNVANNNIGLTAFPERSNIGYVDTRDVSSIGSGLFDEEGNIRILKTTWKSKKKVGELTYTDEKTGLEQKTVVSESYKKEDGEKIRWFWINEYWSANLIHDDILLDWGPRKMQFRGMDNISLCKSGYIGTIYNANNSQSVSLMDRLLPWIYMYTVTWYRTELLMAANQGKIALIDLALIPDGWEIEKWMYYATAMKFGFVDSFNESKKGQSTGKLAGTMNAQNKYLDLETGSQIQGYISLLDYIENKIQEVAGTPDQRMGAISASETVGNARGAVTQSSHITEKWFQTHNHTKKRVLSALIETAKEAWKEDTKKLQYVTDDLASTFFSVDGAEFNNAEYGVFISDSSKDIEALQALKDLTHAAMQNENIMLSSVADIYQSESLSDVKAKLEKAEAAISKRRQQESENNNKVQSEIEAKKAELEDKKIEYDYYKTDEDNRTKVEIAEINSFKFQQDQDVNDNGVPDQLEIAKLKTQVDFNNRKLDIEERKLKHSEEKSKEEIKIKKKQADKKPQKA